MESLLTEKIDNRWNPLTIDGRCGKIDIKYNLRMEENTRYHSC